MKEFGCLRCISLSLYLFGFLAGKSVHDKGLLDAGLCEFGQLEFVRSAANV
jgi:hypothetical protein